MSATNQQFEPNWLAPEMPSAMFKRAVEVFKIPSTMYNEASMSIFIASFLKSENIPYTVDLYGNILVSKGEGMRPCFCAHLDTVHMYRNGFNVYSEKDKEHNRIYLYAEDEKEDRVGIGGDDKCGIFVCLELLRIVPNIKVVFFTSEESGGTGSNNISLTFFKDCTFLGGIDRWNGHDFINSYMGDRTISKAFAADLRPILDAYEYEFASGLFTDCFNVQQRKIGISCFNLSCGYYAHHSDKEYVDTNELYHAFLLCYDLCALTERYGYQLPESKFVESCSKYNTWYKDKDGKWMKGESSWTKSAGSYVDRWAEDRVYDPATDPKRSLPENTTKTPAIRVCEYCGIELLPTEHRFCYSCRNYHYDDEYRIYN